MFNQYRKKFDKLIALEIVNTKYHLQEFKCLCLTLTEEKALLINENVNNLKNDMSNIKNINNFDIIRKHVFRLSSIFPDGLDLIILKLYISKLKDKRIIIKKNIMILEYKINQYKKLSESYKQPPLEFYHKVYSEHQYNFADEVKNMRTTNEIIEDLKNTIHKSEQLLKTCVIQLTNISNGINYSMDLMRKIVKY